jgi:Uma2 family endonuclease
MWHQEALSAAANMLREEADWRGVTWGVCQVIELRGLLRPDGTAYTPWPDIMVLKQPIWGNQEGVDLDVVGTPLFVAEIAGTLTVRNELEGKPIAYALTGIPEYLLFDPSGTLLDSPIVAWRLPYPGAKVYQPWLPEPDGSWRSQTLNVWFVPDPPFLRVRSSRGRLLDTPLESARRARREAAARVDAEARVLQAEAQARQAEEALRQQQERMDAVLAELERLQARLEPQNDS